MTVPTTSAKPMACPGTPLPWHMDEVDPGTIKLVGPSNGFCADIIGHIRDFSDDNARQNAAYIVEACNSYPTLMAETARLSGLVARLGEAIDAYERLLLPVSMTIAETEMCDDGPITDDFTLFAFSGSGASDHTTVGDLRKARSLAILARATPPASEVEHG
jgi:hypothetical protein